MGRPCKDYTGRICGVWKVIERDMNPKSKSHETFWICECQTCGSRASVRKSDLDKEPRACNNCKGALISSILENKGFTTYKVNIGDEFGYLEMIGKPYTKKNKIYCPCRCICGKELDIRKDHLLGLNHSRTISCGCASRSSGEVKIAKILKENNVKFIEQYRTPKFSMSSPFDFALFKEDQLLGLLEFDGEQHFKSVDFFGGKDRFELQQQRDAKKNQWCAENNIRLVRIPYTEYDNISIGYLKSYFPEL